MPNRGLPYARGYRKDYTSQQEAFDQRKRSAPRQDGWLVTSIEGDGVTTSTNSAAFTQNTMHFLRVPVRQYDIRLEQALTHVVTGVAGTLRLGIYVYTPLDRSLHLVAGSRVDDDIGTTGRKENPVSCSLLAGEQYFIGASVDSGATIVAVNLMVAPHRIPTIAVVEPPATVRVEDLTQTVAGVFPYVYFYSREAAKVYLG